jgi:predicted secreted Zn-dependent protease
MQTISLLLILGFLSQNAFAEVIERLDHRYYDVHIAANQSLVSALNQASPIQYKGKVYHGYTKWNVRWKFRWSSDDNGMCRIISSTTTIQGTILLPRLASATQAQKSQFDAYVTSLLEHELGHYQIGKEAAQAIDKQILSYPTASECRALEKAVNSGAHQTLEEYQETERQYDIVTMHGKTQGAWLTD